MRFFLAIILSVCIISPVVSNDLIIDKKGNEFRGTIIKSDKKAVVMHLDSTATDSIIEFTQSDLFMIKLANGQKEVFQSVHEQVYQDPLISSRRFSVTLLGQCGIFGLFNVEDTFTKGEITFGFTPVFDAQLNRFFSVGGECMFLFGKPETPDDFRVIINPNLRGKGSFPLSSKITIDALVAGGVSLWPKTEGTAYLDSTFLNSRIGWNARAELGGEYIINPRLSIILTAGYIANSSSSQNIWITHDMMIMGLGPKVRF